MSRTYKDRPAFVKIAEDSTKDPRNNFDHDHHDIGRAHYSSSPATLDGEELTPRTFCKAKHAKELAEYQRFLFANGIEYSIFSTGFGKKFASFGDFLMRYHHFDNAPGCKGCDEDVRVNTYADPFTPVMQYADHCTAGEKLFDSSFGSHYMLTAEGKYAPCTPQLSFKSQLHYSDHYDHGTGYCSNSGKVENYQRARARDIGRQSAKLYNTNGVLEEEDCDGLTYVEHQYCYC